MVVCKCRKATKLYCFVHKVPVCGECICFPEHQICVVRTYSEWVIDGEYDWPPKCCFCQTVLGEENGSQTNRLGCLHVIHTNCLASHIKSFPPHTAPAGYVCPACSTSYLWATKDIYHPKGKSTHTTAEIWPPKSVKDSASRLHSKLKEAIMQTGLEKNLFGNHPVSSSLVDSHSPPPAFASDPLVNMGNNTSSTKDEITMIAGNSAASGTPSSKLSAKDIMEIDGPSSAASFVKSSSPGGPGATTRKGVHVDRQNSEISYYADDKDSNRKKYTKRGPFRHKFLRALLPFWSSALPTLPVTAPSRKDGSNMSEAPEGHARHQRSSRMDPRKILLLIAIMACMATMAILYYRLVQQGPGEELLVDEQR